MHDPSSDVIEEVLPLLDRRYRLGRIIARGGMAIVCEATHRILGTSCAVKLIVRDRYTDERAKQRMLREAELLARARHPNVVPVLDAGECAERGAYVVMELLSGRPLDGFLTSRSRLSMEETVGVVRGIGAALHATHERGILHRDVKPSNVVLTAGANGAGAAVLVDFGVACYASEAAPSHDKLTKPGELPGTLEYMAPEFVAGRPADRTTDLYALGVLAFECLTGQVPYPGGFVLFERSSTERSPIASLERAQVPEGLAQVIARSIALDPADRFRTVGDFLAAFEASLAVAESTRVAQQRREAAVADALARRAHVRVPYVAPARVLRIGGSDIDGRTEDVAEGGTLLITQHALALGDVVMVRMPLPVSGRLETFPATVRWVKPGRLRHAIGIAFDSITESARAEIQQYVTICGAAELRSIAESTPSSSLRPP